MAKIFKREKIIINLTYLIMIFSLTSLLAEGIKLDLSIMKQLIFVGLGGFIIKFFLFKPLFFYGLILLSSIVLIMVDKYYLPIIYKYIV